MTERTVEDEPEYNNESEKQLVDEEFQEEADEMTRTVADELKRTTRVEDLPEPDRGEDLNYAVPPGFSEPEGEA
jgi:hypothetical protein